VFLPRDEFALYISTEYESISVKPNVDSSVNINKFIIKKNLLGTFT